MLVDVRDVIATLRRCQFRDEYDDSALDFEAVVHDASFAARVDAFEAREFGNTTEPELIDPIVEGRDIATKLAAYQYLVEQGKLAVQKLERDVAPTVKKYHLPEEGPIGRAEKMIEANDRMLGRLSQVAGTIGAKNADVNANVANLVALSREKKCYDEFFVNALAAYRDLVNSHIELLGKSRQNTTNMKLLMHIVSSLGQTLLFRSPSSAHELVPSWVLLQIFEQEAKLRAEEAAALEALAMSQRSDESATTEPLTPADLQRLLTTKRRSTAHSRRQMSRIGPTLSIIFATRQFAFEKVRFFHLRPRIEILHGLAFAAQLSGFSFGVDKKFKDTISAFLNEFGNSSVEALNARTTECGAWLAENAGWLNRVSAGLLIRAKDSIAMQTETIARFEVENQTGDAPPPVKGRAGKKK
jgi:hypothetical protein